MAVSLKAEGEVNVLFNIKRDIKPFAEACFSIERYDVMIESSFLNELMSEVF